jgi:hypothetical protein
MERRTIPRIIRPTFAEIGLLLIGGISFTYAGWLIYLAMK